MPITLSNGSNLQAIENAIGTLIQANLGVPFTLGDYTKIVQGTPWVVVEHGRMASPTKNRNPNFEDYEWQIPIHVFFDYVNDAETHRLFTEYRVAIINLFIKHRQLDDGNAGTYPLGTAGQALDTKIISSPLPTYFDLDGKSYALMTLTMWVMERLYAHV